MGCCVFELNNGYNGEKCATPKIYMHGGADAASWAITK